MVLQGLKHSTFLGWASGVILIKSPFGTPEAPKKKSPFTLFVFILFIANILIRLDFYTKHQSTLKGESSVTKFLHLSLLMGETVFDIFFRVNFVFRSKLVVRFLKALESDMKKFAVHLQLTIRDKKDWKFCERFIYLTLLCHFISGVLVSFWVNNILHVPPKKGSLLLRILPEWLYTIIFYVIGELPITCSISVAFATVLVTTFHVLWIFYDFCESVQEQVMISNGQESQTFVKHNLGELDSIFTVAASAIHNQSRENSRYRGELVTPDKLVAKLEHLKLICSQFDKICGPLLLGLIVRSVYILISSANSILLYENPEGELDKKAKYHLDLFLFPTEFLQLWLLQLGCMFSRKIHERKEELSRMVIFMTNLEARTDLRNVMSAFTEWDWVLTGGPEFFDVNRPLLSGVVSSLMTYVTIIFQLNAPSSSSEMEVTTVSSNVTESYFENVTNDGL